MDKNPFPKFDIFPSVGRVREAARRFGNFVLRPHVLSPVSEHFQHPLDTEPEPVTELPGQKPCYPDQLFSWEQDTAEYSLADLEAALGHSILQGEMTAEDAYRRLGDA
jgi:hypothetical protein